MTTDTHIIILLVPMYDDYSLTYTLWLTGVNIVSYKIINTINIFQ